MNKTNHTHTTGEKIPQSVEKIKMQCRDKSGELLAYYNDVESLEEAIGIKLRWSKTYKNFYHIISINFFS